MQSIDYNLALLEIILEEFEAYILSSVVYWPLSTKGKSKKIAPPPRLTLGGLYLTLDELASQNSEMNRDQNSLYRRLMIIFERSISKWQVGVEQKAQQELNSRLNLWQAYSRDLEDNPENIEEYSREVRTRVMISHLVDLCGSRHQIEEKLQILNGIDQRIESFVKANSFLWAEQLNEVYPQEKFPFLYRSRPSYLEQ